MNNKVNMLLTLVASVTVFLMMLCSAIAPVVTYKMAVPNYTDPRKICTQAVDATVSAITANDDETYTPVYDFTYNKVTYSVSGATIEKTPKFSVGTEKQVFIEPENPYHVYDPDFDLVKFRQKNLIINLSIRGAVALAAVITSVIAVVRYRKKESGGN